MGIIADSLRTAVAQPKPVAADDGSLLEEAVRGTNSGLTGIGGGLRAVAGTVGEALGADEFAQGQYQAAREAQLRAQQEAPSVSSYKQVDGLRSGLRYGAGLVGGSAPSILAGTGAALATGGAAVPAMLAAAAAQVPMEMGDVAMKQLDDPDAMAMGAGERLGRQVMGGAGSAALQGIVPGMLGGKILGRGAGEMAKLPTKSIIGRNLIGGTLAEGAFEGGGDAVKQFASNDAAPLDWESIKENAIGGAVAGGAMGSVGAAADLMHATPRKAISGAQSGLQATGEALAPAWDSLKRGAASMKDAMPEDVKEAMSSMGGTIKEQADAARTKLAELMAAEDVPAEIKGKLAEAGKFLGNQSNRAYVWAAARAQTGAKKGPADEEVEDVITTLQKLGEPEDDSADRVLKGQPLGDTEEFASATPERASEMLGASVEWSKKQAVELLRKAGLSEEQRAKITETVNNWDDKISPKVVAGISKGVKGAETIARKIRALSRGIVDGIKEPTDGIKKSEDYSGFDKRILEEVAPVAVQAMAAKHGVDPSSIPADEINELAPVLRQIGQKFAKGDKFDVALLRLKLADLLGSEGASRVMQAMAPMVTGNNREAAANYFRSLEAMDRESKAHKGVRELVEKYAKKYEGNKDALADTLVQWASGHFDKPDMTVEQRRYSALKVQDYIDEVFGSKAQHVLAALDREYGERKGRTGVDTYESEHGEQSADQDLTTGRSGQEREAKPSFVGGGKQRNELIMNPAADKYAAENGTKPTAERIIAELLAKRNTENVDAKWVSAKDRPEMLESLPSHRKFLREARKQAEAELAPQLKAARASQDEGHIKNVTDKVQARVAELEQAKIAEYHRDGLGMVEHTELPDGDGFSREDMDRMQLAQGKGELSKISVNGRNLDAVKVTRAMTNKINAEKTWTKEDDAAGSLGRIQRAFMDGAAQLMAQYGNFEIPDSTVVARSGGSAITYGEIKKVQRDGGTNFRQPKLNEVGKNKRFKDGTIHERRLMSGREAQSTDRNVDEVDKNIDEVDRWIEDATSQIEAYEADKKYDVAKKDDKEPLDIQKTREFLGAMTDYRARLEEELDSRNEADHTQDVLRDMGKHSTSEGGNIHLAAAGSKDKDLEHRVNMDGSQIKYAGSGTPKKDQVAPTLAKRSVLAKMQEARAAKKAEQGPTVATKLAEFKDYLDNPPEDYSDDKVGKIAEWATKQEARLREAISKLDIETQGDEYNRLDDMRMDATSLRESAEKHIRNLQDMDAADKKNGTNLFGKNGGTPDPKLVAAKKAAFLGKARSGDAALLKALAESTDAKGLQRALDALLDEGTTEQGFVAARDVINERLTQLVQDPDVAYGLQTKKYSLDASKATNPTPLSRTRRSQLLAAIHELLGNSVQVEFADLMHSGEFFTKAGTDIIRVSVTAANPLGTAYHEALHAFFKQMRTHGSEDVNAVLTRLANTPHVMKQLRDLLAHSPEALRQLSDPEERVAYMFQFFSMGHDFKLADAPKTLFTKLKEKFLKLMGIWTNDARALHILEYFDSGEYAKHMGDHKAVREALMGKGNGHAGVAKVQEMTKPFMDLAEYVLGAGAANLRDSAVPSLARIADAIKKRGVDEGGDMGYLPAARETRAEYLNKYADIIAGADEAKLNDVLEALQTGGQAKTPEGRIMQRQVRKLLDNVRDYMMKKGVDVGDMGYGGDYFPRRWDPHYLSKHKAEFMDMARKYPEWKNPEETYNKLVANDGSEIQVVTTKPGMSSLHKRVLSFIDHADAAPFMSKNMHQTMNSYITQATRRAEWAARFADDNSGLNTLLEKAEAEGATKRQISDARKFVEGVNGTLGDDLNPNARRLMGNMVVYQNIRLLPLAVFSMAVDPMGVLVNGGGFKQAFDTFVRGIKEIPKGLRGDLSLDAQTKFAQDIGTIDNAMLTHAIGSMYTQGVTGDFARKANDLFFRFNLVEQMNTSVRVGATEAARLFLLKHGGQGDEHSVRRLAELGLTKADIKTDANGELVVDDKVKKAINQWVDGAVLRPDAADKPIWMNDPHFMLISHLKQFVYAFQHTILTRVLHESKHGNYAPSMALLSYIPVMMMSDMLKGLIQGGGDVPEWKRGWDAGDYLGSAIQRAGLLGVGQFGLDAATGRIGGLTGPTVEQFAEMAATMGGYEQFSKTALRALPANALYAGALKAEKPDPTFVN